MSQQPMNLRRGFALLRRRKTVVGVAVGLGLIAGAAFGSINPPALTSQALVVLPTVGPTIATQLVIATSDPVLAAAVPNISPAVPGIATLRRDVTVTNLSPTIVSFSAQGQTAAGAESIANSVANSYIGYLASSQSPVGKLNARMLQSATTASGPSPITHRAVYGIVGALAGLIVGLIVALASALGDRRLRSRDDIANAIGVPVLASMPVSHARNAQDWAKLIDSYEPGVVHAWRLRKTLQHLNVAGLNLTGTREAGGSSVVVISLASDPDALALGPQLAVFAASLGIPTALAIGQAQDPNAAAALRAACAGWNGGKASLRVTVLGDDGPGVPRGAALTVVVDVVDGKNPQLANTMRTTATLIGVSAGGATAEQLARVAMSAAVDGREVAGLLVADPDPSDETTGRIPQLPRPAPRMPTRTTDGTTTEVRR